ncbi:MAG: EAL domain-containing protein, partial [Thermomicrobiaceae bacterium]|nr:EAL domain-containing protein [Thermomicrobiaceae bacterium]
IVAVIFLDLDDFKVINDSLGHKAGDQLLVEVGRRLQGCIRHGDTVARLGGDEFTVLLEDIDDIQRAVDVADRIADALSAPFDLDGYEVFVSTSIGIARRVAPGDGPDDLLRNADVALYDAKNQGKNRHAVFDPAMTSRAWERIALEADLRHALERGQLRVHYQPVVDLVGGRIVEVEALVRWQHPERGLLPPADFIPLAEETGLIVPIGQWVLTEAARQVRAWQLAHPTEPPLVLAVNLSVRQFQQPDLVDDIARILAQEGLPPTSLKLELTESAALRDEAQAVATLQALRALGVHLAFDDFGTGYSAVSYLRRFPVDTLKIDRSFVDGLGVDPDDTAIVRGVVAFAKMLNLRVTAEGVETAEQLGELRTVGCDCGQGYYIARPLPAEDLGALLSEGASW